MAKLHFTPTTLFLLCEMSPALVTLSDLDVELEATGLISCFPSSSRLDRTRPDGDERLRNQRCFGFDFESFRTILLFRCIVVILPPKSTSSYLQHVCVFFFFFLTFFLFKVPFCSVPSSPSHYHLMPAQLSVIVASRDGWQQHSL